MTEPRAKTDRKLATQWHAATPEGVKAFRIETDQTGDCGPVPSPYLLHGPRNSYALIRNKVNPEMMFSINHANFMRSGKVAGYTWFTDADGTLRPVK
jgi:hypothetical protein